MQVALPDPLRDDPDASAAARGIAACVHCGFCSAVCPTYQLLGDELDSPRGRIYLIKQVLEGAPATDVTRLHLDRCLTCRACEPACPSGVPYGRIVDAGRQQLAMQLARPRFERWRRALLVRWLTGATFAPSLRIARWLRPLLPVSLRQRIPVAPAGGDWPTAVHARQVLLLAGCVQPTLSPNINGATARVLAALGIQTMIAPEAHCCGAISQHLDEHETAREHARRNIDAWWPQVEAGVEAIVSNASGCGAMVKDYATLLAADARYAARAARISGLCCDISQLLTREADALQALLGKSAGRMVFHPPCTLQNALRLGGVVESLLTRLGVELLPFAESHLCCGSAGTYSILQPELSGRLRQRKLTALEAAAPERILSANIGCLTHLAAGTRTPVQHWVEWLDEQLRRGRAG